MDDYHNDVNEMCQLICYFHLTNYQRQKERRFEYFFNLQTLNNTECGMKKICRAVKKCVSKHKNKK